MLKRLHQRVETAERSGKRKQRKKGEEDAESDSHPRGKIKRTHGGG